MSALPLRTSLSLLLTVFAAVAMHSEATAQDRPPNVVIILVDDLGQRDLGCMGSTIYETPNVDRLAREGIRFTSAYAACAVCSPTRAALLTGRHPARIGITDWIHHASPVTKAAVQAGAYQPGYDPPANRPLLTPRNHGFLAHDEVTIAEMLKPHGYRSAHVGKWHLGPKGWLPTDQGFDVNVGGFEVGSPPSYFDPFTSKRFQQIPGLASRKPGEYLTDREGDEAAAFIDAHAERPFFLHLAHYAVHSPLHAHPDKIEYYRQKILSDPEAKQRVPVYAAMVDSVDRAVGKVLAALERNDLTRDTIVVFTSDNGGAQHFAATDNAPLSKGKGFATEGGLRVPLIIRWPGVIEPGSESDVPVISQDLLPTLAEALRIPAPKTALDGLSLMPLLTGRAKTLKRDTLVWHFPHYWWGTRIQPYSVIRQGGLKLIRRYTTGEHELFDVANDVSEDRELAKQRPADVARLSARLDAELQRLGAKLPVRNPAYRSGRARTQEPAAGPEVVVGPPQPDSDAGNRDRALPLVSNWRNALDRPWVGAEYWANPMEDWRVRGGRLECTDTRPGHTVHALTRELAPRPGTLELGVRVGWLEGGRRAQNRAESWAGFRIAIQDEIDDYRARLLRGRGIPAGLRGDGTLILGDRRRETGAEWRIAHLRLRARPLGKQFMLTLVATDADKGTEIGRILITVPSARLRGNLALAQDIDSKNERRQRRNGARFWFEQWSIAGTKVDSHPDRAFGPVLWTMHTLSDSVLKLTAQLPPLGQEDDREVRFATRSGERWHTQDQQTIDHHARTATFRIADWKANENRRYRVSYSLRSRAGDPIEHHYEGTIRRDPAHKKVVSVAAFTGNGDMGFPNLEITQNVTKHDPDLLFFSGDQIYEQVGGFGIVRKPIERASLNYLRKWYLVGLSFGELMRDRPTVCLPDDHDVYQGNVWGAGGKRITEWKRNVYGAVGGYYQSADFVRMVERTQCAHLPDPFDPTPVEQGIGVYYTKLVYGRIGFAILEDRKFKTGPAYLWPASRKGRVDHVTEKDFDPRSVDRPDASLLGDRQLDFVRAFTTDWQGQDMKCALSQTIFANLANEHGPNRQFLAADLDSNGWPQSKRDQALRELRKGFVFHLAGDQHLASLIHYGVDTHADSGLAFCVPSIAVTYPRRWTPDAWGYVAQHRAPDAAPHTGDYRDGLGNRVRVFAVGNPEDQNRRGRMNSLHDKASGYAMVRFDRTKRSITTECWRLQVDVEKPTTQDQFPGWPRTFSMFDNYGRAAAAHLPTVRVTKGTDPVVQVIHEATGEVLYTVRAQGNTFRPKVFDAAATYKVVVDGRSFAGVKPGGGFLDV